MQLIITSSLIIRLNITKGEEKPDCNNENINQTYFKPYVQIVMRYLLFSISAILLIGNMVSGISDHNPRLEICISPDK